MKNLYEITETEVREVCKLAGDPYISHLTNIDGKWNDIQLEIYIQTTSKDTSADNSYILIFKNGNIIQWRTDGTPGDVKFVHINVQSIIDYLISQGYSFA